MKYYVKMPLTLNFLYLTNCINKDEIEIMIRAQDIVNLKSPFVTLKKGSLDTKASRVCARENVQAESLVFVAKDLDAEIALSNNCSILIAQEKIKPPENLAPKIAWFSTPAVNLAMSAVLPLFDLKPKRFEYPANNHYVHPTAKIGKNVQLGPFCVIGANATVGDNCHIGPHVTIENEAQIGRECILHGNVFIGAKCIVGDQCEIHSHTTLGSDGFGFASDKNFDHYKIPQLGKVVLGNRVEIGAGCAIDRATFGETRIGSGTKMDNLCHIAHNCEIGENSLIAAGFGMAGSSKIGRNFVTGGYSVVSDHVTITDNVIIAGRTTVTNDITEAGQYGGYPIQPLQDALKTISSIQNLPQMRKQINLILKFLNIKSDN